MHQHKAKCSHFHLLLQYSISHGYSHANILRLVFLSAGLGGPNCTSGRKYSQVWGGYADEPAQFHFLAIPRGLEVTRWVTGRIIAYHGKSRRHYCARIQRRTWENAWRIEFREKGSVYSSRIHSTIGRSQEVNTALLHSAKYKALSYYYK